jgi:diaminopimelate epimerase
MRFAKGHGTENDFVILVDPDDTQGLSPALAARLCQRRTGIGADGVLRAVRTAALVADGGLGALAMPGAGGGHGGTGGRAPRRQDATRTGGASGAGDDPGRGPARIPEWFMDYRNSDGSLAEMCGNGVRVFARYLAERGLAEGPAFTVATRSGFRDVRLEDDGNVTADMGGVAVLGRGRAVIGGKVCQGVRISVGNPHLACLVDTPLADFDLSEAPGLDPGQFPDGANVELVQVEGSGVARMRVHERGSGETRSCGTGAVAAAVAAARASGRDSGTWQLGVPGGQLTVILEAGGSWLSGPAVIVAEGELDRAWLAAAAAGHS